MSVYIYITSENKMMVVTQLSTQHTRFPVPQCKTSGIGTCLEPIRLPVFADGKLQAIASGSQTGASMN